MLNVSQAEPNGGSGRARRLVDELADRRRQPLALHPDVLGFPDFRGMILGQVQARLERRPVGLTAASASG
jgi:hypothetical protein